MKFKLLISQNFHGQNQNDTSTSVFEYTNPVTRDSALSMRDHFIKKVDDKWYCAGTSMPIWTGRNPGVRLLVSDDLVNWEHHSWIIDAEKFSDSRNSLHLGQILVNR
jgi:beta-xylosidase